MSHVVTIATQVHDPRAIAAACRRLDLPVCLPGTATLFSSQVSGLLVRLPNWLYPVVVDLKTAQLHYDNYQGHWGDPQQLDRFLQAYAVEKARIEAQKQGHALTERALADGSITLTIHLRGAS